jgi:tetratricopeptide (TPR) repeat protein
MIETIREKARRFDWNNPDAVIDFYEDNQLYFDNYEILEDIDTIIDVIDMKSHYMGALISKKRYNKALSYIDHIDFLLNKIKDNSGEYERLKIRNQFHKGVILGYLKKYRQSFDIFSKLLKLDPENDLYKDWYVQMKTNLLYNRMRILGLGGLAIVFGDIIAGLGFNYNFDNRFVLFGFILLLLSWLIPTGMKYLNKRKLNKE